MAHSGPDTPVALGDLSLKERLALCERAEAACVERFREIAGRSDPSDKPLLGLIRDLVAEEEGHLADIRRFSEKVPAPPGWRLDEELLARLIRLRFPSFGRVFGEGFLSRDVALYFAECLEMESSRFYRALADGAPDGESRDFFRRVAEGEESHLKCLQTTLL